MDDSEHNAPFEVLVFGPFTKGQVVVTWHDMARPTSPEIEDHIARVWQRKKGEAAVHGQILFNGRNARYLSHTVEREHLHLRVGPCDYRDFVGTNLYGGDLLAAMPWDYYANPVGTTAALLSSDGYCLYGRRSRRVSYHGGYLHTFGGALEEADRRAGDTVDAFAAVRRELNEELHLRPEDIKEMCCLGIVRDHEIHQPEMIFDAAITLTRDELLARFDPHEADQEHTGIESYADAPEALLPFIGQSRPVAPVALAAMMLHGRRCWGDDWHARFQFQHGS